MDPSGQPAAWTDKTVRQGRIKDMTSPRIGKNHDFLPLVNFAICLFPFIWFSLRVSYSGLCPKLIFGQYDVEMHLLYEYDKYMKKVWIQAMTEGEKECG